MSYEQKISRAKPGLIVFDVDDSGSEKDPLPGTTDPKYQWVERYVGILLKELLARSTELRGDEAIVKARYFLTVVIYGSTPRLWGAETMDIQACVDKYAQEANSLGLGGNLGETDALASLEMIYDHLSRTIIDERFRQSFPPMVFRLTDGMSQSDARQMAEKVKALSTEDGNVLVVNAYIGTQTDLSYKGPEDFPGYVDVSEVGPSEDNISLFEMSSEMPETIRMNLIEDGIFPALREGARLFFDVRTKEMLKHTIQVVGSLGSRADRELR